MVLYIFDGEKVKNNCSTATVAQNPSSPKRAFFQLPLRGAKFPLKGRKKDAIGDSPLTQ